MITEHTKCRLCGDRRLRWILGLGEQYVVDFVKPEQVAVAQQAPKAPLILVECASCGLVQLTHSVEASRLFDHFWYRSSVNDSMVAALDDVAAAVQRLIPEHGTVLDIGCNDGTLMRHLRFRRLQAAGVDPALNVLALASAFGPVVHGYFNTGKAFEAAKTLGGKQFDAITSVAMFYDLNRPVPFLENVRESLAEGGVFICQQNYLKAMVDNLAWDNICHEHVCYWGVKTMQQALDAAGLELFRVEFNQVNGGSFRVYAGHPGEHAVDVTVADSLKAESGLDMGGLSGAFAEQITETRSILIDSPKPVWIYGASTRGSTLLQALDMGPGFFGGAAERDPHKVGLVTAGTWIPIHDEKTARKEAACFLVLPWHFRDAIVDRERDWLAGGGRMLFPLPTPELVTGEVAA